MKRSNKLVNVFILIITYYALFELSKK